MSLEADMVVEGGSKMIKTKFNLGDTVYFIVRVRSPEVRITCPECEGRGYLLTTTSIQKTCRYCNGNKTISEFVFYEKVEKGEICSITNEDKNDPYIFYSVFNSCDDFTDSDLYSTEEEARFAIR